MRLDGQDFSRVRNEHNRLIKFPWYPGKGAALKEIVGPIVERTSDPTGDEVKKNLAKLNLAEMKPGWKLIRLLYELYPGADEFVDGGVTYRGFTFRPNGNDLLRRAQDTWREVGTVAAACHAMTSQMHYNDMVRGGGWNPDVEVGIKLYKEWFDQGLTSQWCLSEAKSIFAKLNRAVNSEPFEIVCDADPENPAGACEERTDIFGFCVPGEKKYRFYISALFWTGTAAQISGGCSKVAGKSAKTYAANRQEIFTAMNASTITMLHELTHIDAIAGTIDHKPDGYNRETCRRLARESPVEAIGNAENFALFAKAVLMRMRGHNVVEYEPSAEAKLKREKIAAMIKGKT